MKTKTLFALIGLILALVSAGNAAAAPARMVATLQVAQDNSILFLHGSHFTPGSTVSITATDARTGKVVARDTAPVATRTFHCPSGYEQYCGWRNSTAGTIDDQLTIRGGAVRLSVRYRDGNITGAVSVQRL
jgi:hypothetical protein